VGETSNMISLQNVTKTYQIGPSLIKALDNVNLSIEVGEMVAIMGPSGSGKSTLMNIVGCLDVPTAGTYSLKDRKVEELSENELADIRGTNIGFIFQTYNLLPRLTALANVELPLLYDGSKNTKARALEALEKVGIEDRKNHKPSELSGGQQQRVGIARALVKNPSIILADEPTGNLDSKTGVEIMALLQQLNKNSKITVVVVTHEEEIANYNDRVITFRDGSIVSDKPVSDKTLISDNYLSNRIANNEN